jgi:hypothetical protein
MVQVSRWRAAALALASLPIVAVGCSEAPEESGTAVVEAPEAVVEEEPDAAVEAEAGAPAEEAADEEAVRKAATVAAMRAHTEEALAVLKRSSDFLGQQQSFSFEAHVGFDVLQLNGQKLEFGGTRKATVRRPDRVHVEARQRDGDQMTLFFDGETISVDIPGENAYVSVERPGNLDAALDYLVEDLGTPAPLEDFFSSDLYAEVKDKLRSGFYVEEEMIAGQLCHHLAFSAPEVDVQIWIEDGERPLPRRVVITYKTADGSPQFWAQFHGWDLSPETPDELFAYAPPDGAEQLPIQAVVREVEEAAEGR